VTPQEYLRFIEPRSRNRFTPVPEARLAVYEATRDVLLAGPMDLRAAVALAMAAATRHSAEPKKVWRLVRRYRAQTHTQPEQLKLPI
jgi:hypothetical protein